MGTILANIKAMRESNAQTKANKTGNADFKKAVFEQYPQIDPKLFQGLDVLPGADSIYRLYALRFYFGLTHGANDQKIKARLNELWKKANSEWAIFGDLVKAEKEGSAELTRAVDELVNEAIAKQVETGKPFAFNPQSFVDKLLNVTSWEAMLNEGGEDKNDEEFIIPDDFNDKKDHLFKVLPKSEHDKLGNLTFCVSMAILPDSDDEATDAQRAHALRIFNDLYEQHKNDEPQSQEEAPSAPVTEKKEETQLTLSNVPKVEDTTRKLTADLFIELKKEHRNRLVKLFHPASDATIKRIDKIFADVLEAFEKETLKTEGELIEMINKGIKDNKILAKLHDEIEKKEKAQQTKEQALSADKADRLARLPIIKTALEAIENGKAFATVEGFGVADFLAINSYPFNRETVDRIKKEHLKGSIISNLQKEVAIVKLDKERNADIWAAIEEQFKETPELLSLPWMKFDGHSRAEAWSTLTDEGKWHLERPADLFIKVYQGEEYTSPYIKQEVEIFGSKASDLSTEEMAQMANKSLGLALKSDFAAKSWKSAFKLVGIKSEEQGRTDYAETLKMLDVFSLSNRYTKKDERGNNPFVSTGIKGGILKAVRLANDEDSSATLDLANQFIKEFFFAAGLVSPTKGWNPTTDEHKEISALVSWIEKKVTAGANHGGNYDSELSAKFESYFENYAKDKSKPENKAA